MGIHKTITVSVSGTCDRCGYGIFSSRPAYSVYDTRALSVGPALREFKKAGWYIGKTEILCPECRPRRKGRGK